MTYDRWTSAERRRIEQEPCENCHAKPGEACWSITKAGVAKPRRTIKDYHALRVLKAFTPKYPPNAAGGGNTTKSNQGE